MLDPEAKKAYQREYMKRKRQKVVRPVLDQPPKMLDLVLDPKLDPPPDKCLTCKEYERGYSEGLEEGKKQATLSMPAPEIVAPGRSCEPDIQPVLPKLSDVPIQRPVYTCNYFNPQPKSTKPDKPGRCVPAATRAPTVKAVALPESSGLVTHHPSCTCATCKPPHIYKDAINSIVDRASHLPAPVNSKPVHTRTHAKRKG
jgi:hypothetical protein